MSTDAVSTNGVTDDDLALAFDLAADAAAISLSWSGGDVPTTIKQDGSPVSEGDLEVDRTLSDILAEERPEDGVVTEEAPERTGTSGRRWIIDPIDGTKQFVAGEPGWGNHIALEIGGEIVLGIITRPEDDELWWAVRGLGAFHAGLEAPDDRSRPLQLRQRTELSAAVISGYGATATDLAALGGSWTARTAPMFGDFFTGELDGLLLRGGKIWDYAPLVVLAQQAGGDVRSPDGARNLTQEALVCASLPLLEPLCDAVFG